MKKCLFILLFALLIGIIVCATGCEFTENEYRLSESGDSYILTNGSSRSTKIPSKYNSLPVVAIGKKAFNNSRIKKIELPDSIERIEYSAFYNCSRLKEITIPKGVVTIENYAFAKCENLRTVNVESEILDYVADDAFYQTAWLYDRRDCLKYLGSILYSYSALPANIEIRKGTKKIACSFNDSSEIERVSFPSSITEIPDGLFSMCKNLSEITFEENSNIRSIGQTAFLCCNLKSINIPCEGDGLIIKECAFAGNVNLQTVTLPERTLILYGAFSLCGMDSFYIPRRTAFFEKNSPVIETVTEGASKSFHDRVKEAVSNTLEIENNKDSFMDSLYEMFYRIFCKKFEVAEGHPLYQVKNNCLISNYNKKLLFAGENASVPDDGSVATIGKLSFTMNDITEITIPSSVETIEYRAFADCESLIKVDIENGVKIIGKEAFGRAQIKDLFIPQSVTSLSYDAFYSGSLESATVDKDNEFYRSQTNCIIEKETKTLILGSNNSIIPNDDIEIIGSHAFYRCSSLTEITIPETVKYIGEYAFSFCSELTEITIPSSVEKIDGYAFYYCSNLKKISFPADGNLVEIMEYAFNYCNKVEEIDVPSSVCKIEKQAFNNCESLKKIAVRNENVVMDFTAFDLYADYDYIALPVHVLASLKSQTNFKTLEIIGSGRLSHLFTYCPNLTEIIIGDGFTLIDENFFFHCENLEKVVLPNSLRVIKSLAFNSCMKLKEIVFLGTEQEWKEVNKNIDWDYNTGEYTVTFATI